jgi:predicted trehalose synthase
MWLGAKALADWIPPYVAGNVFDRFVGPQNMVVIPSLPKTSATRLAEFVRGALLESFDELDQVAGVGESLAQEVNVVGHDAVGVRAKLSPAAAAMSFSSSQRPVAGSEKNAARVSVHAVTKYVRRPM